jgi:hypothetical protein
MALSSTTALQSGDEPGAVKILDSTQKGDAEDENEWEYEYSTTETEVGKLS